MRTMGLCVVDFDRLKLEFQGSRITSNAGILAHRQLEDAHGDQLFVGPTRDKRGQLLATLKPSMAASTNT